MAALALAAMLVGVGAAVRHAGSPRARGTGRHQAAVVDAAAPPRPSPSAEPTGAAERRSALADDIVQYSSQLVTASRALEHRRGADALFDDPLAEKLCDAASLKRAEDRPISARIAIRTRYFDDWLLRQLGAVRSAAPQIVIAAAGMDTRVYRLPLPQRATLFEIDLPEVVQEKEQLLAKVRPPPEPRCELRRFDANLTSPQWRDALVRHGFDGERRSVWLVEGLLYYLSEDDVKSLFQAIASMSAAGSVLLTSLVTSLGDTPRDPDGRGMSYGVRYRLGSAFKWSCADPAAFFGAFGFHVDTQHALGSEHASYGRWKTDGSYTSLYVSMTLRK